MIECRLSLCGNFLSGTYTDVKTGKMATVEGYRRTLTLNSFASVRSTVLKSALLASMAVGKFSANLITLMSTHPPEAIPTTPSANLGDDYDPAMLSASKGRTLSTLTDDDGADSVLGEVGEVAGDPAQQPSDKDKDNEDVPDVSILIRKWMKSELFSGGLPMNRSLVVYLRDQFLRFISPLAATDFEETNRNVDREDAIESLLSGGMCVTGGEKIPSEQLLLSADSGPVCIPGLVDWWARRVFPALFDHLSELESLSEEYIALTGLGSGPGTDSPLFVQKVSKPIKDAFMTPEETLEDPLERAVNLEAYTLDFIKDLVAGSGAGACLDDYMSHHVGQSALAKVGGESMKVARRLVLAALVKHSGCGPLCVTESDALKAGYKNNSDRPPKLLVVRNLLVFLCFTNIYDLFHQFTTITLGCMA